MGVNLIFKIAAVGILVSVLGQVLKHSGREEQALDRKSTRLNSSHAHKSRMPSCA